MASGQLFGKLSAGRVVPALPAPAAHLVWHSLFLVLVPLTAHLLFSRLGFNPTDDGFVLAASRRLLAGEIPHRDFISIHTAGSDVLHLPFVLWGGDRVFLISRLFVWFEFASIALAWSCALRRLMGAAPEQLTEIAIAAVAFAFCCHFFPLMAWHTIDGLFFSSLGILLCLKRSIAARIVGYLLIGTAFLCKQSYFFVLPATVLILDDRRRLFPWIVGLAPAAIYFAVISATGALPDALLQLGAHTDLVSLGFDKFLWEYALPWGVLTGYVIAHVLYPPEHALRPNGLVGASAGLGVLLIVLSACLALARGRFLGAPSFGLFGLALGATFQYLIEEKELRQRGAAGALVVIVAWCSALSVGYNTPAIASGVCAAYLLWLVRAAPLASRIFVWQRPVPYWLLAGLALISFRSAREDYVYLDRPASELLFPLDDVLPGASGLLTGENTYAFLRDLGETIGHLSGRRFVIIPDLAAYWVAAKELNRLPTDWPNWIELGRPELLARVLNELDTQRGKQVVIVEKIDPFTLAHGPVLMPDSERYAVVAHVRGTYRRIDETQFFEVYE